ncbi:MAG: DUF4013 domain-containing protein, partial [Chloroflexota bacterium]
MPPLTRETLTWFFKDADWKNKFLIGSLMFLAGYIVPIVGGLGMLVAFGYGLSILRALARGETPTPPKWDRYELFFLDGVKAVLAGVGYAIPVILGTLGAFAFLLGGVVVSIFSRVNADRASAVAFPTPLLCGGLGFFALLMLVNVLSLIFAIPLAIAVGQYARTGSIRAAYRLDQVWKIFHANVDGFIVALVLYWAIGIGLSIVTVILYFTVVLCLLSEFVAAPIL